MEVKEAEKIVIAKPVASRPTCSKFRSFTELVSGAISVSPSDACYENAVRTFRPRTVRFKPAGERVVSSQDNCRVHELQCYSDKFLKSDCTKGVIYKPIARVVPKTTVSVLAKLGRCNSIQDQDLDEANPQMPNFTKNISNFDCENHQNLLSQPNNEKTIDKSTTEVENFGEEQRSVPRTGNNDRSYDGYNWRKYGQKHVKGSKYPRSYYKCTHPNCPVKKKVEHTLDGQIAEIVYKGEHNHSKPYIINRNSFDGPCQVNAGIGSAPFQPSLMNGGHEGNDDSVIEYRLSAHSSNSRQAAAFYDPNTTAISNLGVSSLDHSSGQSGEVDEGYDCMDMVDEERKRKTRKSGHQLNETCSLVQGTDVIGDQQASIDSEITKDGFRWRKYGQKIVKGNSYPRSYYKCTNQKCNVRKYVERTSEDPNAFITTYEGKHNHEMPKKSTHFSMAKTSANPLSAIELMHQTDY